MKDTMFDFTLLVLLSLVPVLLASSAGRSQSSEDRPRAREAGITVGVFAPGSVNAITDVAGVQVGQVSVIRGDSIRTGVTAVLPHDGNVFHRRVPAAIYVGNGFGKLIGVTQVRELGELETPILLTCTLCVWKAADAMVDSLLVREDMSEVRSINPVVGETNDGYLNDIRSRPIERSHVVKALRRASPGAVREGSVGAGTGTRALGWKGGIGTSSRQLPESRGGHTVGVLVQSNFGGRLSINGAPVWRELNRSSGGDSLQENPGGSIMIVVATDAPLQARNLERLAKRSTIGLGRTGSAMSNGSGDYVIAFSTISNPPAESLTNEAMTPLFQAVAEATEEAIYNSLFRATTVRARGRVVEALPLQPTLEVLEQYNALDGAVNDSSDQP